MLNLKKMVSALLGVTMVSNMALSMPALQKKQSSVHMFMMVMKLHMM